MAIPVLMIAGIFFLVTMVLAVGPLMLCRLFTVRSESCAPRESRHPFVTAMLTSCGFLMAVAVGVVAIYFARGESPDGGTRVADRPATVADPVEFAATSVAAERSLFDGNMSPSDPTPKANGESHMFMILVTLLLVTSCVALLGDWLRRGLPRISPVIVTGGLIVLALVLARFERQEQADKAAVRAELHSQSLDHRAQLQARPMIAAAQRKTVDPDGDSSAESETHDAEAVILPLSDAAPSESKSFAVIEYTGTHAVGVTREALPEWTQQTDGDGPLRVLKSGKHATVELAEQQALTELKSQLLDEFTRRHPEASNWQPPDELVVHSGSLLRRAIERSQITVGEFTSPMYEAYWQVDPTITDEWLYNAWRPTVVHQRLAWLGGGIGLLTLLLGSLAAGLRVDEQTGGKRRKALTLGALAVWAVVGGAILFVA